MRKPDESGRHRNLREEPMSISDIIRTYADPLVRFAFSLVGSSAAAEDIVEDAIAQLAAGSKVFGYDYQLRAYLYKVTRCRCMDHLRRCRREIPLSDVENVLYSADEAELVEHRLRDEKIYACMQVLPGAYREVLQLAYFDSFSVKEICRIMGRSQKQVYNLLSRARSTLRDLLTKEGISYEDI